MNRLKIYKNSREIRSLLSLDQSRKQVVHILMELNQKRSGLEDQSSISEGQVICLMKISRFQVKVCILKSEIPVLSSLPKYLWLASLSAGEEREGFLSAETDQFNRRQ